jgi:hypothetical protein
MKAQKFSSSRNCSHEESLVFTESKPMSRKLAKAQNRFKSSREVSFVDRLSNGGIALLLGSEIRSSRRGMGL